MFTAYLKQNWIKIGLGIVVLFALIFVVKQKDDSQKTVMTDNTVQSTAPSPTIISEKDPRILALEQSLPRFTDYSVKVYPIPPKPVVNHNSNPYGSLYKTSLDQMIDTATDWTTELGGGSSHPRTTYDMAGHYMIDRYGTGNPNVLIVDGLTGKVFHEYGGFTFISKPGSSLVIFDQFDMSAFTSSGDYNCDYNCDYDNGCDIRYAKWNGKQFITICKPTIKNWKVVSCGN